MNIKLVSAVFLLFIGSASSQLTPWDDQIFEFQLAPSDPTITGCSEIAITWNDIPTALPASTPPYTITVLCAGYQPILIATEPSQGYNWTVGLPKGDAYIMFMKDANGFSGGVSRAFSVEDPAAGVTCPSGTYSYETLHLTSTSTDVAECSTLVVTAAAGSAPYTMQIIGASRPPKTTTWTTRQMSYVVDMELGEQFFVLVKDANGVSGAEGMHNVTSGEDTGCYNQATTVSAGSLPTTLSYNPSSTFSDPSGAESTNVIHNTATTTLVTTVTAADGSRSTMTLAPGASATIVANTPTNGTSSPMSAIVGGVVGGAVFLFFLILFLWWRRRAARAKQVGMQEIYDPQSMPIGASPYIPPPGRDAAPLIGRMSSTNSTGSRHTTSPSTPGMSFFGGHNNPTTPGYEETQPWGDHNNLTTPGREEPPSWAIPIPSPTDSNIYNNYSGGTPPLTESSSMHGRSASISSRPNGLPPGAMIPNPRGRMPEKARFVPATPSIVAPPSYTHGG